MVLLIVSTNPKLREVILPACEQKRRLTKIMLSDLKNVHESLVFVLCFEKFTNNNNCQFYRFSYSLNGLNLPHPNVDSGQNKIINLIEIIEI